MISRLRGRPVARDAEGVVLDVAGVGYRLHATPRAVQKADGAAEVVLDTHLHVREDTLQLYGFADAGERELFEAIPGIGRKTAQRVVLELKEKIAPLAPVPDSAPGDADAHLVARDALVELGYSLVEAERRLAETDPALPAAERVRKALRAA